MLDNVAYVLAVVLPLSAAWAHFSHTMLQARRVSENAATDRVRLNIEDANTRAKTAEHELALLNALSELDEHRTFIAELRAEVADHSKQISKLNDRE